MNTRTGAAILFGAFLLAGGAIVAAFALMFRDARATMDDAPALEPSDWTPLIGAAALYVLAHLLRALRLTVMIHDERVGLRDTFSAHFVAAGASLLIPFKLGEVFRVAEVARLLRSPLRAALLVWSERVLDLVAITGAMLLALIFRPDLFSSAAMGVFLTGAVIISTFLAFYVLPENLEGVKMFFIRRYTAPWSLRAVQGTDALQRLLLHAPDALRHRPTTLITLTLVVWTLEITALALFLPRAADALSATLTGTAFFFSQLFPSSMGPLDAILARVLPGTTGHTLTAFYPTAIFLAFLVCALGAFLAVLPTRITLAREALRAGTLASLPRWARDASAAGEGGTP